MHPRHPYKLSYRQWLAWVSLLGLGSILIMAALTRFGHLPPPHLLTTLVCFEGCATEPAPSIHTPLPPNKTLNPDRPLHQLTAEPLDPTQTSLLIEKSRYRLTLYYQGQPLKSYPVVFGDPVGDKLREGDRKTPEGILRIHDRYPHPSWGKFLWLDYPNPDSWRKHNRAKADRTIPRRASIGGEVGIHGVPQGQDAWVDRRHNWTLGCPSVKWADIHELYDAVQVGTIVEIVP